MMRSLIIGLTAMLAACSSQSNEPSAFEQAEISENRALVFSGRNGWADRIHTYLGGDDRTTFRTYRCAIANQGSDEVALLRGTITTRRMAEACRNAEHNFVNLYWIDESRGEIVQSRQWAGPNLGAVSTRRAGVPQ